MSEKDRADFERTSTNHTDEHQKLTIVRRTPA